MVYEMVSAMMTQMCKVTSGDPVHTLLLAQPDDAYKFWEYPPTLIHGT